MIEFEFDPIKSAENLRKHGVPLSLGADVLGDPDRIEREDRSMDYGEVRYVALGMVRAVVCVAVYTERADRTRFISVRPADRREADFYFKERG